MERKTYTYIISGYYVATNNTTGVSETKHFWKELEAHSNTEAMKIVIGELAWKESLEDNSFYLDFIHYD